MDKVRLGRALGYGTRHAARTLSAVAEAVTAQDPRAAERVRVEPRPETPAAQAEARKTTGGPRPTRPTMKQVQGASRSFLGPLAAFSSALLLRVSGLFFALVGFALGAGAWRLRWVLSGRSHTPEEAQHFWVFLGFAVLFSYFAVSGFVRANRRERRA